MATNGPSSLRKFFSRHVDEEKVEEEILSMVEEGHEQGVIEENEVEMISNIFELNEKNAKDIMTSRQKLLAIENTTSISDTLKFALDNSYTRYPVYEEDIDNIIGVVHLRDMIIAFLDNPDKLVTSVMDEPLYVHPTYAIDKLLHKMQSQKLHMAVVVDEYGQTEGIVTMEDIIEEIVGNIQDEHDEDEEIHIKKLPNGDCIAEGAEPLDDIAELLDIEFPDEDIETLNGFLLYQLGRLPEDNESIEIIYQGYKFTPLKICDKMMELVKIQKNNTISEE